MYFCYIESSLPLFFPHYHNPVKITLGIGDHLLWFIKSVKTIQYRENTYIQDPFMQKMNVLARFYDPLDTLFNWTSIIPHSTPF